MFEKEAEEWLERYKFRVFYEGKCNDPNLYAWSALAIKECYIAGAEFGYNKANEWHFVKDEDLPKENQLVLLYRENPNGANVALTYWYKSYVKDKVIAWKEIVLPELPKESE